MILTGTFTVNVISFGENADSCAALKLISASCHTPLFTINTNLPSPSTSGLKLICCFSYFLYDVGVLTTPIFLPYVSVRVVLTNAEPLKYTSIIPTPALADVSNGVKSNWYSVFFVNVRLSFGKNLNNPTDDE